MERVKKAVGTTRDDHIDGMVWTWKKIAAKFWDDAAPYEYLLKQYLGGKYYNLRAKENPVEVWRAFKMKAGAMAEEMINHGAHDIRSGRLITRGPAQVLRDRGEGRALHRGLHRLHLRQARQDLDQTRRRRGAD